MNTGEREGESMAKGNHSFTEGDIRKRFGAIVGHTVAEVDTAGVLAASSASRNKGRIGAVIEQSVLGYPADQLVVIILLTSRAFRFTCISFFFSYYSSCPFSL